MGCRPCEEGEESFLLFSGYLKGVHLREERGRRVVRLSLVNEDVRIAYGEIFADWLDDGLASVGRWHSGPFPQAHGRVRVKRNRTP
jgi:hypothetical protein